jgi:hypothetical protein
MERALGISGTYVPVPGLHQSLCRNTKQYRNTSPVSPLYHCRPKPRTSFSFVQAAISEGAMMDTAYQPWVGQAVVLQVALGDIKVPLRGRLLKDGGETLRMRIGDGWDVDIYKTMVMAVEEDAMALIPA